MRRIFKYELTIEDVQVIETFTSFEPLSVKVQKGTPVLYAIVDDETEMQKVRIRTYGTGFGVEPYTMKDEYVGTYLLHEGELVFHVFCQAYAHPKSVLPMTEKERERIRKYLDGRKEGTK